MKCAKPQEWNSGAAIIVRLAARAAGSSRTAPRAGSSAVGLAALGALRRAGRARGEDDEAARARRAARGRRRAAAAISSLERRRRRSPSVLAPRRRSAAAAPPALGEQLGELLVVDQRRGLLALHHVGELRAGEGGVQVERDGAELGSTASVASTKPRWLRHMIATPSPVPTPSSRRARGRARSSAGASSREGERAGLVDDRDRRPGGVIAAPATRAAGEAPQRTQRSRRPGPACRAASAGSSRPRCSVLQVEGDVAERPSAAAMRVAASRALSRS